jgi:hypothetical protein
MVLIVTINPTQLMQSRKHSNGSEGKIASAMTVQVLHVAILSNYMLDVTVYKKYILKKQKIIKLAPYKM